MSNLRQILKKYTGETSATLCWVTLMTLVYFRGKKVMMK